MTAVDGFRFHRCDHMYIAEGERTHPGVWHGGELRPFGPVSITPHASVLSYGLGVFEGLKARRTPDDRVLLFRPHENAGRMQRSGARLGLPGYPVDSFVAAVDQVVAANRALVPPVGQGTFYVRPILHAIDAMLGLEPSTAWRFLVYGSPVGSYFTGAPDAGLRLRLLDQTRCARGGTGASKSIGNYAGGIQVAARWKEQGFDDVLYRDDDGGVAETSGSNFFARLRDGTVVTPPLSDQILAGITRDSVLQLLVEDLRVPVVQRHLSLTELFEEAVEVFCTGTAWTVRSVGDIVAEDQVGSFAEQDLQRDLLDRLRAIQSGTVDHRTEWIHEVPQ